MSNLKNEKGQTIILVAMMVLSFLLFFSFAVNTGLLIQAKISVQSAADAAAYAGAATQARQLNGISFLNYDMRRQYKKFLFRNVVAGSSGSPMFPNNPPGATGAQYQFPKLDYSGSASGTLTGLKVPVICIPLVVGSDDNCIRINARNNTLDLKNSLGLGAIISGPVQTMIDANIQINNIVAQACSGSGVINKFVLNQWLFRGDNDQTQQQAELHQILNAAYANQSSPNAAAQEAALLAAVSTLSRGLGLYPRNLLNFMRIQTLKSFINEGPKTVTEDEVKAFEHSAMNAESNERTILAFKSALSNLNASVFDSSKVTMEELQPGNMLNLQEVTAKFSVFIQMIEPNPDTSGGSATYCNTRVAEFKVNDVPVGVKLASGGNQNVIYAVRLKTFIKPGGLLFSKWTGDLELDAVAGAKPFGSRIGPKAIQGSDFVKTLYGLPQVNGNPICQGTYCVIPNLDVGSGNDFFSVPFLTEIMRMASDPAQVGKLTTAGIIKAQRHAVAPDPSEVGHYNIIPPPPSSSVKGQGDRQKAFNYEFIPYAPLTLEPDSPQVYRFYAPIFKKADGADINSYITKFLGNTLTDTTRDPWGMAPADLMSGVQTALSGYVNNYLTKGGSAQTEFGESETFAAIELPMADIEPGPYWLNQAKDVLTSWGPLTRTGDQNTDYGLTRRFGYSVRFVALRDLIPQGVSDTDGELDTVTH